MTTSVNKSYRRPARKIGCMLTIVSKLHLSAWFQ